MKLPIKLVDQRDPLAPDEQNPQVARLERLYKKLLQKLMSSSGITAAIGLVLAVLMSAVLSINYLGSSKYIDEQGISLQDVYADHQLQVLDVAETDRKTQRATQGVPLIYQNTDPINQAVHESLNHILLDLEDLTNEDPGQGEEEAKRTANMVNEVPEAKSLLERLSERRLTKDYWSKLGLIAHETLNRILHKGVSVQDYLDRRDNIIRQQMPKGLPRLEDSVVYFAVNTSLQPNLVVDEKAMSQKRHEVARTVEPITQIYRAGEKIVSQGERVTDVKSAALQKMGKQVNGRNWVASLGVIAITFAFVFTLWGYLYYFDTKRFFKPSYAAMISTLMIGTMGGFVLLANYFQSEPMDPVMLYAMPLGAITLLVSIFTHPRLGLMISFMLVSLAGIILKMPFAPLAVLLFGGLVGVYILSRRLNFRDRGQLMYAGLYISFTNVLMIFAIHLLDSSSFVYNQWNTMITALGWGFFSGILSGILTIGGLPFLESLFRLVTPYTLMELANHDKPLLKRMQFEAPGTFHHSLMVASLSEAAAEAIQADALLTRVGCLYHDIGKMKRPLFFIENQAYFGSDNPHDKLTPRLSKMVITAHPRDSIEMAKQHGIPESVQRFMTEHHGTTMVGYFYNKACQEEGADHVNKSQFRYPGPKPQSKETAIVMLADACESAVRALKNPTVDQIEERIDKIMSGRIEDGQFDNCPLTFRDMQSIKETFVRVLRGIQHNRIEYQQTIMRDLGRRVQPITEKTNADPSRIAEMIQEIKQAAED